MKDRKFYGNLSSLVGIACNLILFASKLVVGLMFGAMAIVADSFNNLSDMGSNVVALLGFKIASRPADREHPFGHARAEYLAAMVVAMIIFILAIELILSAVDKLINPVPTEFNILAIIVMGFSILVKFGMFLFNKALGRKIGSIVIEATAVDSLSDVVATTVILIAMFITKYTGVELDGYMTIGVALFIGYAGFGILKETMSRLIGEGADKDFTKEILTRIKSYDGVLGVHDLEIHNYGPNRIFSSAHVEVDSSVPILTSHDLIDTIEKDLSDVNMVIHLDPIVVNDPIVNQMREKMSDIVKSIDNNFTIHDFRMVVGPTHTNLIFDIVIPFEAKLTEKDIRQRIDNALSHLDGKYYAVFKIDKD